MPASFDYASRQRQPGRHLTGLALVLMLHGLLWWAIQSGLARQVVQVTQHTVEAMLLMDSPPPQTRPEPPQPKTPPPKAAPAPAPTPPAPNSIAVPTAPATPAPPATPTAISPAPAVRTGAAIQPGANCPKPQYPAASRRLEEEGTVSLRFLIGTDGQVLQAEVEKSSGFTRLDDAARNALSKCQFRPGTVDGKPEQSWASIRYTWRLE